MSKQVTLYKKDTNSQIRRWICELVIDSDTPGIKYTDGLLNGKLKDFTFKEAKPKNIGKANETTASQQAELMFEQEVGTKLRNKYFRTAEEAETAIIFSPMLCPSGMKWKDYKNKVFYPAYASPKLDGARCYIQVENGEVVAKTRSGKVWNNVAHIIETVRPFLLAHPEVVLDGELYNHNFKDNFEDLMSIIKTDKPTEQDRELSKNSVQYHIYDFYDSKYPALITQMRMSMLHDKTNGFSTLFTNPYVNLCKSYIVKNEQEFDELHEKALRLGYEGTILRLNHFYEPGKRSKHMLKRKELYDLEATIVDIIEGEGTNVGICAKMKIKLDDGIEQDAGMGKGITHHIAERLLKFKHLHIGKRATFQYFGYTNGGKLRFPKFIRFRDSIDY